MDRSLLALLLRHRSFLLPFLFFVVFGLALQMAVGKAELFLWGNSYYNAFWDGFFRGYTWLGDGMVMLLAALAFCFIKYRYTLVTILAYLYTSAFAQALKHIFKLPRPVSFFKGVHTIRTLNDYTMYQTNSFPSGHSVTAFSFAVVIVYLMPQKKMGWMIFCLFLPVALSRVYLAEHFFQDVFAGSVLGTLLTFQLIWWLENKQWFYSPGLQKRFRF